MTIKTHGRPVSSAPAASLRAALSAPWPLLREAATMLIRSALNAPTFGGAALELGLSRRALERLRVDFPEVFGQSKKKKK